jgi:hypothetical protein
LAIGTNVQAYNAQLAALAALAVNGLIARTAANTVAARSLAAGSTKISITNADGAAGNPTIDVNEADLSLGSIGGTLTLAQGGTGATDAATARTNLGAAASGAVGSSGLTMTTARVLGRTTAATGAVEELTSVPLTLGGTGATGATSARTNLGLGTASNVTFNTVADAKGDLRRVPQNAQTTAYVLVAADSGKNIAITTGGVTLNSGIFVAGDTISVFNNSVNNQNITQGAGVTLRLAGTTLTGNRTIPPYGLCSIMCVAADTFVISGTGLS